jgi:hypothetical protein
MKQSKILALVIAILLPSMTLAQESFSCNYGKRGSCLDYNDKIVDQSSICFNQYTCGYGGFVCKSEFNDITTKYNKLVNSYNNVLNKNQRLVNDYNDVLNKNQRLVNDYNDVLNKNQELVNDYNELFNRYKQLIE